MGDRRDAGEHAGGGQPGQPLPGRSGTLRRGKKGEAAGQNRHQQRLRNKLGLMKKRNRIQHGERKEAPARSTGNAGRPPQSGEKDDPAREIQRELQNAHRRNGAAGDRQHAGEHPAVKRSMVIGAGREKFAIQNFERPIVILLHVRADRGIEQRRRPELPQIEDTQQNSGGGQAEKPSPPRLPEAGTEKSPQLPTGAGSRIHFRKDRRCAGPPFPRPAPPPSARPCFRP